MFNIFNIYSKITDVKNGNQIAGIKQREIDSDMLSFQIDCEY